MCSCSMARTAGARCADSLEVEAKERWGNEKEKVGMEKVGRDKLFFFSLLFFFSPRGVVRGCDEG